MSGAVNSPCPSLMSTGIDSDGCNASTRESASVSEVTGASAEPAFASEPLASTYRTCVSADKDATANQQITGIFLKDEVLPEYAFLYFASHRNNFLDSGVLKTTLPIINQKKLKSLKIKVPSIELQKEVVDYFFEFIKTGDVNKKFDKLSSYLEEINSFKKLVSSSSELGKELLFELTHQTDLLKKTKA